MPMASEVPQYSAHSASNAARFGPIVYLPEASALSITGMSSSRNIANWRARSSEGIACVWSIRVPWVIVEAGSFTRSCYRQREQLSDNYRPKQVKCGEEMIE